MIIRLINGTELDAYAVHGSTTMFQGVQRDSMTFLFDPEKVSLQTVAEQFTDGNTKAIQITDDEGNQYVHENYTIRSGMGVSMEDQIANGGFANAISGLIQKNDPRVWVTMLQSTLAERTIQNQQEIIDALLVQSLM